MNPNQVPPPYNRPTQKAIDTRIQALFWMNVVLVMVLLFCYLTVLSVINRNIMGLCILFPASLIWLSILSEVTQDFQVATKLGATGLTTSGQVIELWQESHHGANSSNTSTTYHFAYHFTVSGNTFGACQKINKSKYNTLQVGDTVTVRYLSTDPAKSRVEW